MNKLITNYPINKIKLISRNILKKYENKWKKIKKMKKN